MKHTSYRMTAAALLVAVSGVAGAQTALTQIFKIDDTAAGSPVWLNAGDQTRGLAYNPATGNLLVADRDSATNGGNGIRRINAATGAEVTPPMDNSVLVSIGTLILVKVGVADDNVIYAANLSGSSASTLKIYRWPSETDPGAVVHTETGISTRVGDDMAVTGSGNNTKILMSGASQPNVHLFTTTDNGMSWSRQEIVCTPPLSGTQSIDFVPGDTSQFWFRRASGGGETQSIVYTISGTNATETRRIGNFAGGATLDAETFGTRNLHAAGPGNIPTTIADVTAAVFTDDGTSDTTSLPTYVTGPLSRATGTVANANGVGDVKLVPNALDNGGRLFVLYTNNSISGWTIPPTTANVRDWSLY